MKRLFLSVFIVLFSTCSFSACRDASVKRAFDKINGYKYGRKGYVVDHVCALACGGIDTVANMQYQSIAAGKAKDKWETKPFGCKKTCNSSNSTPTREVFNCVGKNEKK